MYAKKTACKHRIKKNPPRKRERDSPDVRCTRYSAARERAFAFVRRPIFPLPTYTHTHKYIYSIKPPVCVDCVPPSTVPSCVLFDDRHTYIYIYYVLYIFSDLSFSGSHIHHAKVSKNYRRTPYTADGVSI